MAVWVCYWDWTVNMSLTSCAAWSDVVNGESVERYWLSMNDKHGSVRLNLLLYESPAGFYHARLLLHSRHNNAILQALHDLSTMTMISLICDILLSSDVDRWLATWGKQAVTHSFSYRLVDSHRNRQTDSFSALTRIDIMCWSNVKCNVM